MKEIRESYEVPVRSADGGTVATVELRSEALGGRVHLEAIRRVVRMYGANARAGTASTKTRAEVIGSNRKPWRQKGTGRARAGSRKSPLWRGGGAVFGPKPRDYGFRMNRKVRRRATRSAILGKLADGELCVVEALDFPEPKTRRFAALLRDLGIEGSCLVGTAGVDRSVYLSARNLPGVRVLPVSDWNAYEVLRHGHLLLTRAALEGLVGEAAS